MLLKHLVRGRQERRHGVFSSGKTRLPRRKHLGPKQRGKQKTRGNRFLCGDARVGVAQGLLNETLAGFACEDSVEQWQKSVVQALGAQRLDARDSMPAAQQLEKLIEKPCCRHMTQEIGHIPDRRAGVVFNTKSEFGRKAGHSKHPHRILAVSRCRIANDAQDSGLEIANSMMVVKQLVPNRVKVQGIYGEVTARSVILLATPDIVGEYPAMFIGLGIGLDGTKGGDLDQLATVVHMDNLKTPPNQSRAPEKLDDLLRWRVGGDVEILGTPSKQQITHPAAHHEGRKSGLLQALASAQRCVRDRLKVKTQFARPKHLGMALEPGFRMAIRPWLWAEDPANQGSNHRMGINTTAGPVLFACEKAGCGWGAGRVVGEEFEPSPAKALGMRTQSRVGIRGHWMTDALEKCQIVG